MPSLMKDVWYWSTVGLELMAGNPKVRLENFKHLNSISSIVQFGILGLLFRRTTRQAVCGSTSSLLLKRPVHGLVKCNRSYMTGITGEENKLCVPRRLCPIK